MLWRQLTWPLNSRHSTHGRLSQLTAQDMTAGMKIRHTGVTGMKGGRTPALQHQEQPEEEDRTDNSKAFQKGIKPGQRATPTTVSDHCYGCGEKGHKRPDCPKRVRRVRSPQPKHAFMVQGKIGEIECKKMVLDSGSDITIINSKLITDD